MNKLKTFFLSGLILVFLFSSFGVVIFALGIDNKYNLNSSTYAAGCLGLALIASVALWAIAKLVLSKTH
jgi:hypothetical protein